MTPTADLRPDGTARNRTVRPPDAARTVAAGHATGGPAQAFVALQRDAGNTATSTLLSGAPLPTALRTALESRYGADFGRVRVHRGPAAEAAADAHGARACTVGSDIYLGPGEGDANSVQGRWLLAHELAHVVQQSRAGSASPSSPAMERAADAAADAVEAGGAPVRVFGAVAPGVARAAKEKRRRRSRPKAVIGDIKEYRKQGKSLYKGARRLTEHEHIRARVNLELMTRGPGAASPYGRQAYRRSTTLTIPRDMAVIKTRMDLALRDRIKRGTATVDDVQLEADVERTIRARDEAIAARKQAGLPTTDLVAITDNKIRLAAHGQEGELHRVGKGQPNPLEDMADWEFDVEVERALEPLEPAGIEGPPAADDVVVEPGGAEGAPAEAVGPEPGVAAAAPAENVLSEPSAAEGAPAKAVVPEPEAQATPADTAVVEPAPEPSPERAGEGPGTDVATRAEPSGQRARLHEPAAADRDVGAVPEGEHASEVRTTLRPTNRARTLVAAGVAVATGLLAAALEAKRRHGESVKAGTSDAAAWGEAIAGAGLTFAANLKGGGPAAAVNAHNAYRHARAEGKDVPESLAIASGSASAVGVRPSVGAMAAQGVDLVAQLADAPDSVQLATRTTVEALPSTVAVETLVGGARAVLALARTARGDTKATDKLVKSFAKAGAGLFWQSAAVLTNVAVDMASGDSLEKAATKAAKESEYDEQGRATLMNRLADKTARLYLTVTHDPVELYDPSKADESAVTRRLRRAWTMLAE